MKLIKIVTAFFLILAGPALFAQQEVEMADTLRADGKIYVVVAIVLVIFTGLIIYLFMMDRKISRLEKKFPIKKG